MAEPRGKKKVEGEAATVLPPPDHVSEEIFLRLPPRSAAVSRCVAPSWNRLLSSPAFADRYHAAAAARAADRPRFLTVPVHPNPHQHLCATAARPLVSVACVECPRVFCGAGKTCHGAVLVGRPCQGQFYVCNPFTGGVLHLPPRRPTSCIHSAGLGYDAAAGKLKAVLLERSWAPPRRSPGLPRQRCDAVVVTVGAPPLRWREQKPRGTMAHVTCEGGLVLPKMDPVFADGHLHWIEYLKGVLSFALHDESFRRIPLPPYADDREQWEHSTLAEFDGHLCLVRDLCSLFEVWKHDHKSRSWSLDCRLDLTRHMLELMSPWAVDIFPLCYVRGESSGQSKKMLLVTTGQRAYTYELNTGKLRRVASRTGIMSVYLRLVLYQESIMHIAGMDYGKEDIFVVVDGVSD